MEHQILLSNIRRFIALDDMPTALKTMRSLLENTPKLNEILQQSGRLEKIQREMRLGMVSDSEARLEQNRIRYGVLELLTEIEQKGLSAALGEVLSAVEQESVRPELKSELEGAVFIVNSKNVVSDSKLTAGRDMRIGDDIHHHYGDKKIPRLLTNPPFNSDIFIGRGKDLHAIESAYQAQNRLLVLMNGEGGIGKTTLAAKYWYAHADRYKHLAWVYAEAGIGAALVTLKEKLNVSFAPDDTLETQTARMAEAINNLDAPCLLILDNANNEADLKKHYTLLHRLGNCHILLTSRVRKLANMTVHQVEPLEQADAEELFTRHYPDKAEAERPLLRQILHAVGYNTLVTELLAKNMAVFNRFTRQYDLADLLRDIQAKGLLALKNKTVEVVYGSDTLREAEPTDIITAMYNLTALNDAERRLLSNLAVLPAENLAYALLTTLLGATADDLEAPLGSLEAKGWLEYRKADNTFKISPVVQEVTRIKNAEQLLTDCRTLINNLTTGLNADNRHQNNYQQAAVWVHLGASVIHALPMDFDVVVLCQNIGEYQKDTGNLSAMMQAYQKMMDVQTALCAAEPDNARFKNGLAISYSKLGESHTNLGYLPTALTFHEKANLIIKELHESFPQNVSFKNGLAISYSKLGETHTALFNLPTALTFFEEYNKLEKELHEAYPQNVSFKNSLAISYSKLGMMYSAVGNLPQALAFFEEYNKLEKELHDAYPQNVKFKNGLAVSYSQLGRFYRDKMDDSKKAKPYFQNCHDIWKELSEQFPDYQEFRSNYEWAKNQLGL